MSKAQYDYMEHPKKCAPDDYWGQVCRTVSGKPIPQNQIELIYSMIREALDFKIDDLLLDLACGNGRLGSEFFDEVTGYLGVDNSTVLIEIAKKNFERPLTHTFLLKDVQSYCSEEYNPARFNKGLCFGSVAYFSQHDLVSVLTLLYKKFVYLERIFIASFPDKNRANSFFQDNACHDLNDHTSSIGRWYTQDEIIKLAKMCGWKIHILEMPSRFYQSHYRFNVLLTRG